MRKMLLMFMVSLCAMSCSNVPEEREVTASDVEVSGFIKDYIEVVDGSYMFTNDGEEGRITVKLRLKERPNGSYYITNFPGIRLNAIGENDEIFDTGHYGFEAQYKEFDKVRDLLEKGNVGDTKSISFTWQYLGLDKELASKIFNKATTFEIIDDGFEAGENPDNLNVESEYISEYEECGDEPDEDYDAIIEEHRLNEMAGKVENSAENKTVDYDKWIDEYEEYFNKLLKYYKKIKNGDQSAYIAYMEVLQKFNSLYESLRGAENHMTYAQTLRVSKIMQRFSQEVQQ